jgi:hypothetical protein
MGDEDYGPPIAGQFGQERPEHPELGFAPFRLREKRIQRRQILHAADVEQPPRLAAPTPLTRKHAQLRQARLTQARAQPLRLRAAALIKISLRGTIIDHHAGRIPAPWCVGVPHDENVTRPRQLLQGIERWARPGKKGPDCQATQGEDPRDADPEAAHPAHDALGFFANLFSVPASSRLMFSRCRMMTNSPRIVTTMFNGSGLPRIQLAAGTATAARIEPSET